MYFQTPKCLVCRAAILQRRFFTDELENKYSNEQKEKILQVINDAETDKLSGLVVILLIHNTQTMGKNYYR